MKKIEKVYTDTPLIDEIVRQIKGMIYEGIVLKDQEEANNYETVESLRLSDIYYDIMNGKDLYEMYEYTYSDFIKIPYMSKDLAKYYVKNPSAIPDEIKPQLMKSQREKFVAKYEEQNNYYRRLNGLPDLGDEPIYLSDEQIRKININEFNYGKAIHEMDNNEINILNNYDIIEELQIEYPDKLYLRHLGQKRVDPLVARRATNFSLLYLPSCESGEIYNKFTDFINKNRQYILSTVYSDAFKFSSKYYDKFIMSMIIVQSFVDMIVFSPEYIIRRELFDMRTIQYVFESQGVEFFPNIPLKYQKRLVKNLNRLIKFKSCDKNLIDISQLFGFDNIELFKYHMLKIPIMEEDGSYRSNTTTDPKTGLEVEDLESNYELKFLKVPFDSNVDKSINNPFNLQDYDTFVENDIYWNGTYTKEYVKHTILEKQFNIVISKYIGMDLVYSMTELAFQTVYFMNMLLYSSCDTEKLVIEIPEFSSTMKFPLIDCIITLFSLGYLYKGLEDNIMYHPLQAMDVLGFNFDVDMNKLSEYIAEKGYTPEDLGISNFNIPTNGIYTYNQLINIFTENKNIYKHIIHELTNADNKEIYDIYRTIYDSLFVTKLNFDYFSKSGVKPKTYSEFLSYNNSALYDLIIKCKLITDIDERKNQISNYINTIVENIYIYLDEDIFNNIFHGIPTANTDFIRQYLYQVLNFFKSYKVDFTHINIVYKLDGRYDNWISIIDRLYLKHIFYKEELIPYDDYINTWVHILKKEIIEINENMEMDISYFIERVLKTKVENIDKLVEILVHLLYKENINIIDSIIERIYKYDKSLWINIYDYISKLNVYITNKDELTIEDNMYINYFYDYET